MPRKFIVLACILTTNVILPASSQSQSSDTENVVVVIIDGARYSETFGDSAYTYIPQMGRLAEEGSIISTFYNDSVTSTSRAVPALWSGSWTGVRDTNYLGNNTKYSLKPSIFEYIRKQKDLPPEKCAYAIKYIQSLWLQSFDPDYGPDYWPLYHSVGQTDEDVAEEAKLLMDTYNPRFLWIYLADVDTKGHSGGWESYTSAIRIADSIVADIWAKIQYDRFYMNKTTMFVTNDHGRHDDQNGGFKGHGDDCDGCRHIQFLALGPNIKQNYVSDQHRRIPDMSVTIADILGVDPEQATGEVMSELFITTEIDDADNSVIHFSLEQNYPNPFSAAGGSAYGGNPHTTIAYNLPALKKPSGNNQFASSAGNHVWVTLKVYDLLGREVAALVNTQQRPGSYSVNFDGSFLSSGIYFYTLTAGTFAQTKKMVLLR